MRLFLMLGLTLLAALAMPALAAPVHAGGVIIVTTAADTLADDGQCSLREAVIAANTDAPPGAVPRAAARTRFVSIPRSRRRSRFGS